MLRRRLLLFGLTLAGIAGGVRAAIPESAVVVSCGDDHLVQLDKKNFAVARGADALTRQSPQSLAARALTLLGTIVSPKRFGTRVGARPALFVDMQQPGRAVALLGTDAGRAQQPFDYAVDHTTVDTQMCTPGAAFPAVQQAVAELPELSESTYIEYADDQIALSCRPADRPGAPISHIVRALSFAPATSNVQVMDMTPDVTPSLIHLQQFEDRPSDVRYYPAERFSPPGASDPTPGPAEFLLAKAPILDDLGPGRYPAQFFDGKRTQRLVCEVRQAFASNIEKPLARARELLQPKSLPLPAGTATQAKRELCKDMESFKLLQVRYGELLFKVPGVNSHGIGLYRAGESPVGVECNYLSIGVRSAAQLSQAQAIIGETLEGHLVGYHLQGDLIYFR